MCHPGSSRPIWIKRVFSTQSFERVCLLNSFHKFSFYRRPTPYSRNISGGGGEDIKGLTHKFYPKVIDSCLGVQLHWCPIRFKTSWVLQLSNKFHKTLLVNSPPPQRGTQPGTLTLITTSNCARGTGAGRDSEDLAPPTLAHFHLLDLTCPSPLWSPQWLMAGVMGDMYILVSSE